MAALIEEPSLAHDDVSRFPLVLKTIRFRRQAVPNQLRGDELLHHIIEPCLLIVAHERRAGPIGSLFGYLFELTHGLALTCKRGLPTVDHPTDKGVSFAFGAISCWPGRKRDGANPIAKPVPHRPYASHCRMDRGVRGS